MMTEENLAQQLQQPWIKICTDAGGVDPAWAAQRGPTHPRSYGTYPRVLGKYVREEGVLTLEDAIRKMTSAVADRLGLRDRGLLRAGCYADVVIFDPDDDRRPRHLRGLAPTLGRRARCLGERRARAQRDRAHRRDARPLSCAAPALPDCCY